MFDALMKGREERNPECCSLHLKEYYQLKDIKTYINFIKKLL